MNPPKAADPDAFRIIDLKQAIRAAKADQPAAELSRVTATGQVNSTAVAYNVFAGLLAKDGLRSALYSLLRLTDYRFIAIFRFQDGKATSAVYVDRQNLSVTQADEVPDTATYCCYVRDANGSFVTADSLHDPRTVSHVAREVVRSYCGIPVLTPEGELIGTLCHYDLEPRDPDQLNVELLIQASSAIARSGLVPPYPTLPRAE